MSERSRFACLFFVLSTVAMTTAGNVAPTAPSSEAECARVELIRFSEQFRDLPGSDPAAAEETRISIAAAPDEVVVQLHGMLQQAEGLTALPRVAADLSRALEEHKAAQLQQIIARATAGAGANMDPASEAKARREALLSGVTLLRALRPLAGAEADQQWARIQTMIETAEPGALATIAKVFADGAEQFNRALQGLTIGETATPTPNMNARIRLRIELNGCNDICCTSIPVVGSVCVPGCPAACQAISDAISTALNATISGLNTAISAANSTINSLRDQINGYISQITALTNQVAGFVGQIAQFVTDAFNKTALLFGQLGALITNLDRTFDDLFGRISATFTGFYNQLLALMPITPQAAFALIGIDISSTAWITAAINRFPILEAPCPATDTDLGPLGVVGTLGAAQKSDGLAKLLKIAYDMAPSDVPGLPAKVVAATLYHPAEYWNLCARSRYAIAQADLEVAHRALTTTNLNVALSTRGTQASVTAVSDSVANVDLDVARAETKLDLLAPKTALLLQRLDTPLSTRVKQTSVDDLRGSLRNLDGDVAKVESKLDVLQVNVRQMATNENDGQASLAAFEALLTRIAIEEHLLEEGNDIISLYQLPAAFGGRLDLVRSIVDKTIAALLAAGQSVGSNSQKDLGRGDARMSVGDFAGALKEFRQAYGSAVKP